MTSQKRNWKIHRVKYLCKWFVENVNRRTLKIKLRPEATKIGKRYIGKNEFNDYVKRSLLDNKPFMVARYGSVEATAMYMGIGIELSIIHNLKDKYFNALSINAGFFPTNKEFFPRWLEYMKETSKQVDILCYWETGYQEYLVENCCNQDVVLTDIDNLQPFWSEYPWTGALRGKTVLVVHPFAETIQSQYKNRDKIWKNQEILPEFNLITVKAVQTIAGCRDERFDTWFDALEYMFQEGMKTDFDVAIIACGAYGMPLAAKFKLAGKQAIHWGGMSQIWFGIKGTRWDNNPRVNQFYNKYWVRPSENETPRSSKSVEGGCYW